MDALRPVTFRFSGDTEVHYLARAPEFGDLVSHGHELWTVMQVLVDAAGVIIVCRRPRDRDRHLHPVT